MADLIEKSEVLQRLCAACSNMGSFACISCVIPGIVKDIPPIEAEPVRYGRWINNTFCSYCKRFPVDVSVSISNQELTKYFFTVSALRCSDGRAGREVLRMPAKKCCERCERFMCFNVKTNYGVCLRTMNVVPGSEICDSYQAKPRRKRGAQNGKADSSAESNR